MDARPAASEGLFAALEKYTAPTGYVNYLADDDSDRIVSSYRPCFDRLVEVKQRYNPDNLFRLNHPSQSEHQPFSMS